MNNREITKRDLTLLIICLFLLLLAVVGGSFAYLNATAGQKSQNKITVGTLEITYDDTSSGYGNVINLASALPITDSDGRNSVGYKFKVENTGSLPASYTVQILDDEEAIKADECTDKLLPHEKIKYILDDGAIRYLNSLESKDNVLAGGTLAPGETRDYVVRMWIDEKSGNEVLGKHYHGKIVVNGSQESNVDFEQDPNPPVLVQGQIPVTYDREQSSWVKADVTNNWYNYANQEWANAVTVTEANRETYMNASVGTPISMDDINTMWVWIPRYEYMYTNLGDKYADGTKELPGEIKIKFLDGKDTTASDDTNYKVHPAFTFGSDELDGIWYGKFETSTTDSTCNLSVSVANCNKLMTSLQVKPNVNNWRFVTVSNYFYSIRNMQLLYASTYGFSTTDSDVHMSKNSEWGMVAYLSQSKYGKYGNPDYKGLNKEIYQNKSATYITGMSNGTPSTSTLNTQITYDVEESGTGASTTGNITGIYDMSGGGYEYVMGYLTTGSSSWGASSDGNNYAGFTSKPDDKYFDGYTNTIIEKACNSGICFGQALSETSGWYNDTIALLGSAGPWLYRGDGIDAGIGAGIFGINRGIGAAPVYGASRSVLVPFGA